MTKGWENFTKRLSKLKKEDRHLFIRLTEDGYNSLENMYLFVPLYFLVGMITMMANYEKFNTLLSDPVYLIMIIGLFLFPIILWAFMSSSRIKRYQAILEYLEYLEEKNKKRSIKKKKTKK